MIRHGILLSLVFLLAHMLMNACAKSNSASDDVPKRSGTSANDQPPKASRSTQQSDPTDVDNHSEPAMNIDTNTFWQGPEFSVDLSTTQTDPVQYLILAEVTARTGSWQLRVDEKLIEGGTAKAFLTFEQPAADEIVTQALVDHSARMPIGNIKPVCIEVWVRSTRRGEDHAANSPSYRLAATHDIDDEK